MPPEPKTPAATAEPRRDTDAIGGRVLRALGPPQHLHRVNVHPLWGEFYRVNVLVGQDAVSVRIAHSFFLHADREGNILRAYPPITRLYP